MIKLTPIGSEFESIIAAVILFLFGGVICFVCCFGVTQIYLFYKRRLYRKRHKHDNDGIGDDYEITKSLSKNNNLQNIIINKKIKTKKSDSSSTESTNTN